MGVVRIDDELEKQISAFIQKDENKYRYPSKSAFLNIIIQEHMIKMKNN